MPPTTPLSSGATSALSRTSGPAASPPGISSTRINGSPGRSLQTLRARHHQIIRLSSLAMSNQDIATALGVSENMVSKTLNSELGKQKLASITEAVNLDTIDMIKEFTELAPVALEVVEEVMTNSNEKAADRLNAAKTVLSSAGYGQRNHLEVNVRHVTDEDIKEAKLTARERGRSFGPVIEDVEPIEILDAD